MTDRLDDALAILTGDDCDGIVDLALCMRDGVVRAHARDGMVAFTALGPLRIDGRNPLEHQDPGALSPLASERAALRPGNRENQYPFAYDNIAHLFDNPHAPDIAVVHTPAHNWEDRGGHRGEHGSPDLVQSRAPLIAAGRGIKRLGSIARAARMVDVAPTLAYLAGGAPRPDGPLIARQHGRVLEEIIDAGDPPKRVVAFLCDGSNANVLYAMARSGELPNTAKLMEAGTVYEHGLIASFPTVTLANHTTALTGVHPGVHGVLHNAYYERATGRAVNANSPATWHLARNEISSDVETVFEALNRSAAGFTASVNEPCDRGASYATFDAVRDGGEVVGRLEAALPDPTDIPGATQAFVRSRPEYAWSSAADFMAVQQVRSLWAGEAGNPVPRFLWVNLILNDAGNHAGGPYSDIGHAALRDTDARVGEIMDAIGDDDTAYFILADHGMEESDPECTGDYGEALKRAGIAFRDEGFGFLYLD